MAKFGGTKGWAATVGVALLLAFVAVPALSGAASATPATSAASTDAPTQWAYGGQGWFNATLQSNFGNITYASAFGWTIVFTVTPNPSTPGVWTVEEQRTVAMTVAATYTGAVEQVTYNFHGTESDTGFANVTNQSVVYVNGQPVPALGILNASASVNASISESIAKTVKDHTASATLNVLGVAKASTSFNPSLGLIPLNLSGVNVWNSSATATPSASWNVSYSWTDQGFNGSTASGSGSKVGSLSGTGTVNLTGYKIHTPPPIFRDGKGRTGVVLIVQGVFDSYDAFIWVPHAFDLFGTAVHPYDSLSYGSAGISAQTLYLSPGPGGPAVTAAASTFGANDQSVNALATPESGVAPAATSASPTGSVLAQPMTVAQANAEANCLSHGCSSAASPAVLGGIFDVALIGVAVAVIVGTVGVIEWRSYARRQSQKKGLVGGYGEGWPNGVPPAGAVSPPNANVPEGQDPSGPSNLRP